jgi:hypothetical protein
MSSERIASPRKVVDAGDTSHWSPDVVRAALESAVPLRAQQEGLPRGGPEEEEPGMPRGPQPEPGMPRGGEEPGMPRGGREEEEPGMPRGGEEPGMPRG